MNLFATWVVRSLSLLNLTTRNVSQAPLQSVSITSHSTSFLDHVTPIDGFFGQTFLRENIPFIDIPDSNIQEVYYYRWSALQRHLRYTVPGTGYIITEFMQPVGYAQALNTIDAAAGHQIDEARWLRSQIYDDDYILTYTRGPANSTQYTHWVLDAMFRRSQVSGDTKYTTDHLTDMARLWGYWDYTYDTEVGLYYFTPNWDAQEFSLPGYIVAPSGGDLQYNGPNTYRPNVNAYMVANSRAISLVATQAGDSKTASKFSKIADKLEHSIYKHLWDSDQNFFVDVIRPNNPELAKVQGREGVGLFPFRFGVGLDAKYANLSVQQLFDPQGFFATYGPTTLEQRNKYYAGTKPGGACCYWNGQSWPFSTSHVLKSLATIYRNGSSSLSAEQYVQYLGIYATTQHKNGVPYVAESHYPSQEEWSADGSNHSEHYQHSTNNDDVITGLLGIIPRSDDLLQVSPIVPQNWTYFAIENLHYHGHLLTILYDQDAIDGYLFYDSIPDNRWTNYQSPSTNDTLQITFARPRNISSVTLALFSDVARGGGIDVPARLEIYGSSGSLANLSGGWLLPNDRNTFSFEEVETQFVSVKMFRKPGVWVGLCELEVWVQPDPTPRYYAVDALLTGASVMTDRDSDATKNCAVVGCLGRGSVVAFSGIETAAVEVTVNQVSKGSLNLKGTGGNYHSAAMTVELAGGRNFISLLGGTGNIRYETLDVKML
ncbi:Six-hairpin glycosidase-like protein [Hyaloscypha sp. PMI_1271]|nr:Six-hairpin glycosidase-like protein [Hyaloscypha sp. PMI_1271]